MGLPRATTSLDAMELTDVLPCTTSSGLRTASCTRSLLVRFINLDSRADRLRTISASLERALERDNATVDEAGLERFPLVAAVERFDAMRGNCTEGVEECSRTCQSEARSAVNVTTANLATSVRCQCLRTANAIVGCFTSHVTVIEQFASSATSPPLMLVLEDDATVEPEVFRQLPTIIQEVPKEPAWHVIRFSTRALMYEADRIAPGSSVRRARSHAPDGRNADGEKGAPLLLRTPPCTHPDPCT